jgi:hypothetical protein
MAFADFSARTWQRGAILSPVLHFKAKVALEAIASGEQELSRRPIVIRQSRASAITFMTCQELANRIQRLQPDAGARDVARLCLLLANTSDDVSKLDDDGLLTAAWREAALRLQAATDQHAAMTEELESLARSDPREFTPDQIWILIRAIKVQGQILQLYLGEPVLDA